MSCKSLAFIVVTWEKEIKIYRNKKKEKISKLHKIKQKLDKNIYKIKIKIKIILTSRILLKTNLLLRFFLL